ncbi:MAG TPA: ABC transporter substrate-binding protein [Nitrospira sp.]|nr:ABC transporter substrate-binding protein [Nitrospira sp.]
MIGVVFSMRSAVMLTASLAVVCGIGPSMGDGTGAAQTEIVILKTSNIAAYEQAVEGFKATAPSNAVYAEYDIQGDLEQDRKLIRKVRASDPALVVAVGLKAALAAKAEIADIPVLYMMVLDPLKHNLSAPNMTGILLEIPVDRQLKLIHSFLPGKSKLGVLYDPRRSAAKVKEAEHQNGAHTMTVQGFPVENEKDLPHQLRSLVGPGTALWLMPDSTVLTNESIGFILATSLEHAVPVIGFSPELTRLGALMSLSVTYTEIGRETGLLAKRILGGERRPSKPIPVDKLKITVNMKTARFLGIEFPADVGHLIDETY